MAISISQASDLLWPLVRRINLLDLSNTFEVKLQFLASEMSSSAFETSDPKEAQMIARWMSRGNKEVIVT